MGFLDRALLGSLHRLELHGIQLARLKAVKELPGLIIADLDAIVALCFLNFRIVRITVKVIYRFHGFRKLHGFPVFNRNGCLGMIRRRAVKSDRD